MKAYSCDGGKDDEQSGFIFAETTSIFATQDDFCRGGGTIWQTLHIDHMLSTSLDGMVGI